MSVNKANQIQDLEQAMNSGIVRFSYKKSNGETRVASGTLNEKLIKAYQSMPENGINVYPNYNQMAYFDTEKMAWRSFIIDRLISVGEPRS